MKIYGILASFGDRFIARLMRHSYCAKVPAVAPAEQDFVNKSSMRKAQTTRVNAKVPRLFPEKGSAVIYSQRTFRPTLGRFCSIFRSSSHQPDEKGIDGSTGASVLCSRFKQCAWFPCTPQISGSLGFPTRNKMTSYPLAFGGP